MNTTQLLSAARRLWLGPTNSLIATDEIDLLAHGDAVVKDLMLGLYALKQDFCIAKVSQAMTSGTANYQVPDRAFNALVRHVLHVDSGASDEDGHELDWIDFSKRHHYKSGNGTPTHFWFDGDDVGVNGDPSGNVVIAFPFTPGALVSSDDYRVVASVSGLVVTLTEAPPSGWTTDSKVDVIDSKRAGGPRSWSNQIAVLSGSDITLTDAIDGSGFGTREVSAGDYVALEGKAGRPMIPEILHEALAQGICSRVCQSQGDDAAFQIAKASYETDKQDSYQVLRTRAKQIRVPINLNSMFRRAGGGRRRRR